MFTTDFELIGDTISMADIEDNILAKADKFRTGMEINFRRLGPSVETYGNYSKSPLGTYPYNSSRGNRNKPRTPP